jgi:acyl-CoA synthetase (AMP-forming)/AMP-acid ligase II
VGNGDIVQAAKRCNAPIAEVYWNGNEVVLETGRTNGHVIGQAKETSPPKPEPEDVALILHTSGTTGKPKAVSTRDFIIGSENNFLEVPLTHGNLCRTTANIQSTYQLTSADRTLLVMPLFHVHGLLATFLTPLITGGSCIILARFSTRDFWVDFVEHKANWYTAVPTIHQILLKNTLPTPVLHIRFIRSCSSPLSPSSHKQLETLLGAPVLEAYAMIEAAHRMTSNPLPPAARKPGSVGIPQGLKLQIMDDEGNSLPQDKIVEVCVLGSNVTSGYLGDPKVIASPFTKSGFLRTGDQGYLDEEGYLFLTGRIKELINKGGEEISPIEIDNLLSQHPSIAEAVSFAIEDELYGQNAAAAVMLKEGVTTSKEDIMTWFGTRAVKFKIPKVGNHNSMTCAIAQVI